MVTILVLITTHGFLIFPGERNADGGGQAHRNAAYSLLLPGKVLHLNALNCSSLRKFQDRGNRAGAKEAWLLLQKNGLGELCEVKARRGSPMVCVQNFAIVITLNNTHIPSLPSRHTYIPSLPCNVYHSSHISLLYMLASELTRIEERLAIADFGALNVAREKETDRSASGSYRDVDS